MLYYNHTVDEVLKELRTNAQGLHPTEAAERLQLHGPNVVQVKGEPVWKKLIEPFANVFMLVLFVAAGLSFWHGDVLDAVIVLVIMFVTAVIYYVQRISTERVLRSLQKHNAQNVQVLRDGKMLELDTAQLVPGDVVVLHEGEKIPADARLIDGKGVRADESLLTGESEPIAKQTGTLRGEKEVYERTNMLFQGAFIVAGDATAVVVATGNGTEFGQLAALTTAGAEGESPVQKKIDKLVAVIVAVVGGIAVVAFGLAMLRGTDIVEAIKFVMALSVSAVPESLPVAISVVLVLGMRRMAKRKALVRNMRAIETIGVITTIATDKTGTLTKNKLTVQETWKLPKIQHNLASHAHLSVNQSAATTHDPLDTAMLDYARAEKVPSIKAELVHSLPFSLDYAMSGNIWQAGQQYTLNIKGAPEAVLVRAKLTAAERAAAEDALQRLTAQGYRVIAVAATTLAAPIDSFARLGKTQVDFIGFIAVADMLRPEAHKAIKAALAAGVTVRMITGDHFETAFHIGQKLGMVTAREQVFDARRMNSMSDDELDLAIQNARVFSRVVPENKYRILELLKRHNITAMTGDGVNDVPALANAHVGIAMGSGSQIAKDAGGIVLLDNNFKSIIDAMREGRTIFSNIRRMLFYLLSTSSGEVLTMIGALAIGMPLPITPVQILWVNLVTDTSMVIPLGLEPGEKANMRRRPKAPNAPILSRYMVTRMVLVALTMAATVLGLYWMFSGDYGHAYASTIAFSALVVMQWANAMNARSSYESVFRRLRVWSLPFVLGLTLAVGMQALAVFGPLAPVLNVTPVAHIDLLITGLAAFAVPIITVELHKWYGRRVLHEDSYPHLEAK